MTLSEIFESMLRYFCVVAVGVMISMMIFTSIFDPGDQFGIEVFGQILLTALASVLPYFLFYSRRVLSKREMMGRMVLHFVVLLAVLFACAARWNWVKFDSAPQIMLYVACVVCVYGVVQLATYWQQKKEADLMTERLGSIRKDD